MQGKQRLNTQIALVLLEPLLRSKANLSMHMQKENLSFPFVYKPDIGQEIYQL